ncbi:trp operon leader peptide [Streptomyces sp. NPDC014894]
MRHTAHHPARCATDGVPRARWGMVRRMHAQQSPTGLNQNWWWTAHPAAH